MRRYMVVCVLAIAVLHTAGYPIVTESRIGGSGSTALMKNVEALVDTAPSQPGTRPELESGLPRREVVGWRSGLKKDADSLAVYATQPPGLHVRPSPLLAAVTPTPSQGPCYYLGIVAPGEMDTGILGPYPIPTPQYEPQKPGSIKCCHPAPPMAFVPIPGAQTSVEAPAPRP